MDVELMALGFLKSGPKTGYQLNQIFGKMMLYYSISLNQIYPVLRKLEAEKYVKKETVLQPGRPSKNVYSVTEKGEGYFLEKLTDAPVPIDYYLPFLIKTIFFRFLEEDQVVCEFEKEIRSIEEQIETLGDMEPSVKENADQYGQFAHQTCLHLLRSLRDWYAEEFERRRKRIAKS